jgi:hypothetical protein
MHGLYKYQGALHLMIIINLILKRYSGGLHPGCIVNAGSRKYAVRCT